MFENYHVFETEFAGKRSALKPAKCAAWPAVPA